MSSDSGRVCRHEQSLATYRQVNSDAPSHNSFIHNIYCVAIFGQNGISKHHREIQESVEKSLLHLVQNFEQI